MNILLIDAQGAGSSRIPTLPDKGSKPNGICGKDNRTSTKLENRRPKKNVEIEGLSQMGFMIIPEGKIVQ